MHFLSRCLVQPHYKHVLAKQGITHRFRETKKTTLNKKRYDKTTTRLQSSLESPSSLVSPVETRFSQSRLDSHNRDSILKFETRFSISSLISHNRVSFHTIESRFTQSSLVSHNRVHRGEKDWDRIPKEKIYKWRLVPREHQREEKLRKEMKVRGSLLFSVNWGF